MGCIPHHQSNAAIMEEIASPPALIGVGWDRFSLHEQVTPVPLTLATAGLLAWQRGRRSQLSKPDFGLFAQGQFVIKPVANVKLLQTCTGMNEVRNQPVASGAEVPQREIWNLTSSSP